MIREHNRNGGQFRRVDDDLTKKVISLTTKSFIARTFALAFASAEFAHELTFAALTPLVAGGSEICADGADSPHRSRMRSIATTGTRLSRPTSIVGILPVFAASYEALRP